MRYQKAPMKRRVTVRFGEVKVVVPCPNETMTVADLAEAAILRYKKATNKMDADVRILRMQCIRDEGILDKDDRIVDVFDEVSDQILAIYDEQSPNGSGALLSSTTHEFSIHQPSTHYNKSPVVGRVRNSVVEITSLDNPPSKGLRVSATKDHNEGKWIETQDVSGDGPTSSPPVRSSLRSETSTPSQHRVTLSPEVEKRLADGEKDSRLTRGSARKSRLTESFFDAKDRLDEARELRSPMSRSSHTRIPLQSALDPQNTVVVFADIDETPMGIEVTGVHDDLTSRLSSVQIIRMESDGRVGIDGRLHIGDNIVEIDGRPVYQMSILRVRALLSELQSRPAPSLTVARPISSFGDESSLIRNQPSTSSLHNRPILSALQQANTQLIGHTTVVELEKSYAGFGFTVTGRETAKGERLFYIGTVKPNGVALGHLRAGDRLLEINGESTSGLTQSDVVDRLKQANVGDKVAFLVSRVGIDDDRKLESSEIENRPPTYNRNEAGLSDVEEMELIIPLNDTGSAGLGVSLKVRVTVKSDGTRQDCGIFIKNVLHGGAAHKDGRLRVNDRIVGIEDVNLSGESNATACESVTRKLKAIGPSSKHVRLRIHRAISPSHAREHSHNTIDGIDSTIHLGGSLPSPSKVSVRDSTSSDGEKRASIASDITRLDESERGEADVFNREAPTRKSMSEKRGMGAAVDPHHIKLFQDIKHQRQTSAPPSSLATSSSFHGQSTRSASQRAAARARSHSVHPRAPAPPTIIKSRANETISAKRRSLSVESLSRSGVQNYDKLARQGTPEHIMKKVNRTAPTSHSFRQAIEGGHAEPIYGTMDQPQLRPPGSPVIVQSRSMGRDKDKQRRKSMGSAMKSFFGLKSRETSPEKGEKVNTEETTRRQEEEEQRRRIQEHYIRLREKEAENNRLPSTPSMHREIPHRIYSEYEPMHPNQPSSPTDLPLIVANSRFYHNHRASPICRKVCQVTTRTTSSIDTTHIAILKETELSPEITSTNRRPITTLFPVRNHTMGDQCLDNSTQAIVMIEDQEERLPTTITCSTHGLHTAAEVELEHHQQSMVPTQLQPTSPWNDEKAGVVGLSQSLLLTPPTTHHQPNLLNSTPIAFPSTRFVFAAMPNRSVQSHNTERLSVRARKKMRHRVQSAIVDTREKPQISNTSSHSDIVPSSSSLKYFPASNFSHTSTLMSTQQSPSVLQSMSVARLYPCKSPVNNATSSHRVVRPLSTPDGIRPLLSAVTAHDDSPIYTHSRIVTSIEGPGNSVQLIRGSDFCRVWNDWNSRTGGSLPARRPRNRNRIEGDVFEGITDC